MVNEYILVYYLKKKRIYIYYIFQFHLFGKNFFLLFLLILYRKKIYNPYNLLIILFAITIYNILLFIYNNVRLLI